MQKLDIDKVAIDAMELCTQISYSQLLLLQSISEFRVLNDSEVKNLKACHEVVAKHVAYIQKLKSSELKELMAMPTEDLLELAEEKISLTK